MNSRVRAASKTSGALLVLGATVLASSAQAETAAAGITAVVVRPNEVSASVATQQLIGDSPGMFTLRIPGAASVGTIAVTVSTMNGSSGTVAFSTWSDSKAAVQQLIAQIANAQLAPIGIYQIIGTTSRDTISGQGVQVVVMQSSGDGSKAIVAVITFD